MSAYLHGTTVLSARKQELTKSDRTVIGDYLTTEVGSILDKPIGMAGALALMLLVGGIVGVLAFG